jgi:hypothetical protein
VTRSRRGEGFGSLAEVVDGEEGEVEFAGEGGEEAEESADVFDIVFAAEGDRGEGVDDDEQAGVRTSP